MKVINGLLMCDKKERRLNDPNNRQFSASYFLLMSSKSWKKVILSWNLIELHQIHLLSLIGNILFGLTCAMSAIKIITIQFDFQVQLLWSK